MDMVALILAVVGCVNWGLVGLFQFDLVAWLFGGTGSLLSRILYTLVGFAGLWCITFFFRKAAFRDCGEYAQKAQRRANHRCALFTSWFSI